MPINKPGELTSMDDDQLPILSATLDEICNKALSVKHTSVLPTIGTVAEGEVVIYDDGMGVKRIYVVTGKKNLGYIALT